MQKPNVSEAASTQPELNAFGPRRPKGRISPEISSLLLGTLAKALVLPSVQGPT